MKELLDKIPRVPLDKVKRTILLDTCFIIWMLENEHEKKILDTECCITSFNAEELIYVEAHKIHDKSKARLRDLLKKEHRMRIIDVDVHPGEREKEKSFVESIDPHLLMAVHDPSDAVLAAAAIKTESDIITRDKHHLYTAKLENLLNHRGSRVMNHFED